MEVSFPGGQIALESRYKYQGGDGRIEKGVFVITESYLQGNCCS